MEEHKLKSDKGPDVVITAELLGTVDSEATKDERQGRWFVYQCYRTEKGTLVVHKQGHSIKENERTRYEVITASSDQELVSMVGHNDSAKELYELCGIEYHKRIE